jgi:hypothetical protein
MVILDVPQHPSHEASIMQSYNVAKGIIGSIYQDTNIFGKMYFIKFPSVYGNYYGGDNTSYGGPVIH